jgi:hypothetical protein
VTEETCLNWIKALRSGDYDQGQNDICQDSKFCCLGVLADINGDLDEPIALHSGVVVRKAKGSDSCYFFHDEFDELGQPEDEELRQLFVDEYENQSLAEMNDSGMSFEEIADVIEEHVLPLCSKN